MGIFFSILAADNEDGSRLLSINVMDITQKISLYDILAMIVPGLLLLSLGGIITMGLQPLLLLYHKGGVMEYTFFFDRGIYLRLDLERCNGICF